MEFHPFADEYPMMPEADLQKLATRMRETGFNQLWPIIRFQGKILDGRNRFKAAKISGVDPVYRDFRGTEEEAPQFVEDANEHRRHLTESWLTARRADRISRVMEARASGGSTRAIAETEGVSEAQVRRDLEASTAPGGGAVVTPPTVTGKDGRKRKATRKKKAASPAGDLHAGQSTEERAAARIAAQQQGATTEPDRVQCTLCRGKGTITAKQAASAKFVPPTLEEVRAYCQERGNDVDPEQWMAHYESNGWKVGKNPMKDWKGAVRTWERSEFRTNDKAKGADHHGGIKDWLDKKTKEKARATF